MIAALDRLRLRAQPALDRLDQWLNWISLRTRGWNFREWSPVAIGLQLLLTLLYQLGVWLWPEGQREAAMPELSMEMDFVEFTEQQEVRPADSQDLSEKIQEVDEVRSEVNWNNAVDPALDLNQRYVALLEVNKDPNDYPSSARRANLGRVTVAVRLYIDATSRIRDVRIRRISSDGDAHRPFEQEFVASVRNLLLKKTRVKSRPYIVDGKAQDIVWDTVIAFTLDQ